MNIIFFITLFFYTINYSFSYDTTLINTCTQLISLEYCHHIDNNNSNNNNNQNNDNDYDNTNGKLNININNIFKKELDKMHIIPQSIIFNNTYDTHGFVGYSTKKKQIYTILRGTNSFINWMDDFDIKLINYSYPTTQNNICINCKVHQGFYLYAMSVYNDVYNAIKYIHSTHPTYELIFSAHSLGSSVLFIALKIQADIYILNNKNNKNNIHIITFGSPRLGNKEFAKIISPLINNMRFTHNRDIVPHMPLSIPLFPFMHLDGEYFENEYGIIKYCDGYENNNCSNKYSLYETNTNDHMYFNNHYLGCIY